MYMTKTLEEDNHRDLVFEYPPLGGTTVTSGAPLDFSAFANTGYQYETGTNLYYYESFIDLSGYAMKDLTIYPEFVMQQENFPFSNTSVRLLDDTLNGSMYEYVLITTVPFDLTEAVNSNGESFFGFGGFIGSALTPEQVIYGHVRTFAPNTQLVLSSEFTLMNKMVWGSMAPTAADKLYCYRLISYGGSLGTGAEIFAPAGRFIMPVKIAREPELEYMMRLKRSYELANQI